MIIIFSVIKCNSQHVKDVIDCDYLKTFNRKLVYDLLAAGFVNSLDMNVSNPHSSSVGELLSLFYCS